MDTQNTNTASKNNTVAAITVKNEQHAKPTKTIYIIQYPTQKLTENRPNDIASHDGESGGDGHLEDLSLIHI